VAIINPSNSRLYDQTDRLHKNRHCQEYGNISRTKPREWLSAELKFGVYICTGMLHNIMFIAVWLLGQVFLL
jgi:hypothetical protein